jgi:hypothetical protein
MLRRMPVATPDNTKLARISSFQVEQGVPVR